MQLLLLFMNESTLHVTTIIHLRASNFKTQIIIKQKLDSGSTNFLIKKKQNKQKERLELSLEKLKSLKKILEKIIKNNNNSIYVKNFNFFKFNNTI